MKPYNPEDFDKCDYCESKYIGVTFMDIRYCKEHEDRAEKRSVDYADYKESLRSCEE